MAEPTFWKTNPITFRVSEEFLIDVGRIGPRHRQIEDAERWRQAWNARPGRPLLGFFRTAPPWEWPDPDVGWDIDPLPSLTRLYGVGRAIARFAGEARTRTTAAWGVLRHGEKELEP